MQQRRRSLGEPSGAAEVRASCLAAGSGRLEVEAHEGFHLGRVLPVSQHVGESDLVPVDLLPAVTRQQQDDHGRGRAQVAVVEAHPQGRQPQGHGAGGLVVLVVVGHEVVDHLPVPEAAHQDRHLQRVVHDLGHAEPIAGDRDPGRGCSRPVR